jgi:hypothetical protein
MLISSRSCRAATGAATLALLAACSGGGASGPSGATFPAAGPGSESQSIAGGNLWQTAHFKRSDAVGGQTAAASTALRFDDPESFDSTAPKTGVYAVNYGNEGGNQLGGYFNLYKLPASSKSAPVCAKGGWGEVADINGIGVDANGTLWVPGLDPKDSTNGIVLSYAKNTCRKDEVALADATGEPDDIAFASDGTKYVMDIVNFPKMTNGQIEVYPKGTTAPAFRLKLPGELVGTGSSQGLGLGVATDRRNDVYATYVNTNNGTDISTFAGGKGPGKILQNANGTFYEGMTFDNEGNLVVAASTGGVGAIDIFAPPFTGSPATFAAQGSPIGVALDPANAKLYVGDATNNTIDVYTYPTGKYEYSIAVTTVAPPGAVVEGVAVDPSGNN